MYRPMSLEVTQLVVELPNQEVLISIVEDKYAIETNVYDVKLTEEQIEAIYYGYQKLKTLRKYNNEPQGNYDE